MKKNKLYTVNRFNRPMFMSGENLFVGGGSVVGSLAATNPSDFWGINSSLTRPSIITGQQYLNNFAGKAAVSNPLSFKQAFSSAGLKGALNAGAGAAISAGAGLIGGLAGDAIGGGLQSGAGSAISGIGSTVGSAIGTVNPILGGIVSVGSSLLGGLTNRMFGSKINEENVALVKQKASELNKQGNIAAGSQTNEDVLSNWGNADLGFGFGKSFIGEDGWFSSAASDKYEEMKRLHEAAKRSAIHGLSTGIHNADINLDNDVLANYAAYGGPLDFGTGALGLMQQNRYFDTIDKRSEAIAGKGQTMQTGYTGSTKTFADGGLKAAFLDNFGSDPIGAAVRYNRGLEALAAQEEAKQIEAAREAEYLGLQKRLANLETENQGLQALVAAQSQNPLPEIPESSPSPSRAAYNSNWDYIEDQLKRSGKFNDVQIKGIKYNLQRESALDPTAVGDGGAAFGLGQWHGSRKPKDMSLEGQTQHLIDTLSNFDGAEHWINKRDYQGFLNARTPEEAHYYIAKGYERPQASIVAKVKRDSDMSLKRLNAFGGELGTNGTDFTNGLLYIDEGGSHESNPLDGVPMGLDPEGIPNLVEEGETVYNDYVFSDRMKVPFFMYKELGLGGVMKKKGKEMSFADASKKLAQESEQRPNDPISQDGLEASLARLAEVQEAERMRKQGKEYMGLEGYACGGKMGNKYKGDNKNGQKMKFGFDNPSLGFQMPTLPDIRTMAMIAALPPASKKKAFKSSANPYGEDVDDFVEVTEPEVAAARKAEEEIFEPNFGDPEVRAREDAYGRGSYAPLQEGYFDGKTFHPLNENGEYEGLGDPKTYATWMRYAPAVGSGIMALTDALGLTNKADYSMADKIEAYANRAGYAPNISYNPIGDYLRYTPMDIWYQQNALNAQARATDRTLMNSSSPSRAAGLIANGYNSQLASGNLYRQALEYNDANREKVADFNRRTNMFNSQMGLEAAMANARYQQAARQMGLSGLAQAAALRDSIDARVGAAKSANLTNFLTSLGNIGRENFAMNQINTDRSRHYYGDLSGDVSGYKRKKKSCGGKLNRK